MAVAWVIITDTQQQLPPLLLHLADIEVQSDLLQGATVHFINFCDPSQPRAAKDAAKRELSVIVAKYGGQVVAAATPQVCRAGGVVGSACGELCCTCDYSHCCRDDMLLQLLVAVVLPGLLKLTSVLHHVSTCLICVPVQRCLALLGGWRCPQPLAPAGVCRGPSRTHALPALRGCLTVHVKYRHAITDSFC